MAPLLVGLTHEPVVDSHDRDARVAVLEDATHSPMLGLLLMERLGKEGVEGQFHSGKTPKATDPNANAFLIDGLTD